jgi:hypothetical protein
MIVVLLAVEYSASHLFLTIVALATIAVTLLRPTKYQGINSIIATKNIGQSVHVPEDVSASVPCARVACHQHDSVRVGRSICAAQLKQHCGQSCVFIGH